jgi:hypothetical protein
MTAQELTHSLANDIAILIGVTINGIVAYVMVNLFADRLCFRDSRRLRQSVHNTIFWIWLFALAVFAAHAATVTAALATHHGSIS